MNLKTSSLSNSSPKIIEQLVDLEESKPVLKAQIVAKCILVVILFFFTFELLSEQQPYIILDYANFSIHEFGHTLFSGMGRFMYILGGSLTQILVPVIVTLYFFFTKRYTSSLFGLFWIGDNLINISLYVGDARSRILPLANFFGDGSTEGHDWYNLLSMMNILNLDTTISRIVFTFGVLCIIASIIVLIGSIIISFFKMQQRIKFTSSKQHTDPSPLQNVANNTNQAKSSILKPLLLTFFIVLTIIFGFGLFFISHTTIKNQKTSNTQQNFQLQESQKDISNDIYQKNLLTNQILFFNGPFYLLDPKNKQTKLFSREVEKELKRKNSNISYAAVSPDKNRILVKAREKKVQFAKESEYIISLDGSIREINKNILMAKISPTYLFNSLITIDGWSLNGEQLILSLHNQERNIIASYDLATDSVTELLSEKISSDSCCGYKVLFYNSEKKVLVYTNSSLQKAVYKNLINNTEILFNTPNIKNYNNIAYIKSVPYFILANTVQEKNGLFVSSNNDKLTLYSWYEPTKPLGEIIIDANSLYSKEVVWSSKHTYFALLFRNDPYGNYSKINVYNTEGKLVFSKQIEQASYVSIVFSEDDNNLLFTESFPPSPQKPNITHIVDFSTGKEDVFNPVENGMELFWFK